MFDTLTRMGASAASTYEIERSLRFNSSDSTYLNRTPSSAGNRKTFTLSFWFKPVPEVNGRILEAGSASGVNGTIIYYDNEQFKWGYDEGAYWQFATATPRYRDPSSWYHVVYQIDTTQSTGANRLKIWVNNVSQPITYSAVSGSHITQDKDTHINNNISHAIGRRQHQNDNYLNGYLTEMYFIDGSTIAPSEFAETNATTGQWIPKEYEGSYGNQGWYLNFSDNSNTTSGTLGADSSGNGNNWTPNNFSVSAGVGNDSLEDTPTNNFATLNPLDGYSTAFYSGTNGNLDYNINDTAAIGLSTISIPTSGKWYAECTPNTLESICFGIRETQFVSYSNVFETGILYLYYGKTWKNNSEIETVTAPTSGDIMGCAVDRDNNTVQFSLNGTNVGNTIAMTTTDEYQWWVARGASSGGNPTGSVNFGQRAFSHQPSGFKGLCTKNLPTPTIKNGTDYFNTVLYTGNSNTSQNITGVGFQPNLVWVKNRDNVERHHWVDSVRGDNKMLHSEGNYAERTGSHGAGHTQLNLASDGFNLVSNGSNDELNFGSRTYVAWNWKESASAGFDIVGYTGTGSARTVSHNLGVAPEIMIIKNRDETEPWWVYSSTIGAGKNLRLNETDAQASDGGVLWNSTAPTSSVFTVNTNTGTNGSDDNIIAYLFSSVEGYSKVGAYTGNGDSNGIFIYTGFKPAYLMLKKTSGSGSWKIFDNKRDTYNLTRKQIAADGNGAEEAYDNLDFVSNGIKMRNSFSDTNASGETYIYLAFAETPFKYANAR